jgi:hypothetical protein
VFPTPTNDLQKLIKFVSTSGKVFFGKENEKASEEKPVEKLSGEKPSEQPQFKPKPKLVKIHCGYCGRDGHKEEFGFKRKREERMAKEWANKDRYNLSHGVPKPRMPLPKGKVVVRSVPTWGDASSRSRVAVLERVVRPAWLGGQTGPAQRGAVRPAWPGGSTAPQNFGRSGFRGGESRGFSSGGGVAGGWSGESAGGQLARHSPPRAHYRDGRSRSFEKERKDGPRVVFRGFGPPPDSRVGFLGVVTEVVFVVVALVGKMA